MMKKRIIDFYRFSKCFGLLFTIKYYYYRKTRKDDELIHVVYEYLSNFLATYIKAFDEQYLDADIVTNSENNKSFNVYVCWWQGENDMPELVHSCYSKLKHTLSEKYNLILISEKNFKDYVKIPDFILDKFYKRDISITQFSDILREGLIAQNGGIWIDSTVWTNSNINDYIRRVGDFWSVRLNGVYNKNMYGQVLSQCQWSGFILAGRKNSPVFKLLFECMCEYFKQHELVIDYFIQNFILRIIFDKSIYCQKVLNALESSNPNLYSIETKLNDAFCEEDYTRFNMDTSFFKLTYKGENKKYLNDVKTYYGFICDGNAGMLEK